MCDTPPMQPKAHHQKAPFLRQAEILWPRGLTPLMGDLRYAGGRRGATAEGWRPGQQGSPQQHPCQ